MDKNFRTRLVVTLVMFVVALVSMYTFNEVPFKIIIGLFALVAAVELLSFFKRTKATLGLVSLAILEIIFLVGAVIFVAKTSVANFWYIILGVCGYDIFAYLFGRLFGGRIFGRSRPFPYVSKNKTWEGTILGLLTSLMLVAVLMGVRQSFSVDWPFLFCGIFALVGDLFESFLKRRFKVKDSNEIVIKLPHFDKVEMLVGGAEGHGGFLDRIDSVAFAATILLIIQCFL